MIVGLRCSPRRLALAAPDPAEPAALTLPSSSSRARRGRRIAASLDALAPLRAGGHEVIVVDGGSRDATVAIATAASRPGDRRAARAGLADERRRGRRHRRRAAVPARRHAAPRRRRCGDRRRYPRRPALGALRRDDRGALADAARRRCGDEPPLAPHRHRHRRPGHLRRAIAVRGRRRLPADPAHGGRRALPHAQASRRPPGLPRVAHPHVGAPLGPRWRLAHDPADVAPARGLVAGRRSGAGSRRPTACRPRAAACCRSSPRRPSQARSRRASPRALGDDAAAAAYRELVERHARDGRCRALARHRRGESSCGVRPTSRTPPSPQWSRSHGASAAPRNTATTSARACAVRLRRRSPAATCRC